MDPAQLDFGQRVCYSLYQRELYKRRPSELLPCPTNPADLEARAKECLVDEAWVALSEFAGRGDTYVANLSAFNDYCVVPRALVDTTRRSIAVELFERHIQVPFGFAPIAFSERFHPDGDMGVSWVGAELGVPFCLSSAATSKLEHIGLAITRSSCKWFQMNLPHDDQLALSLMQRASKAGYGALMVTTGTWQVGWRHQELAQANYCGYQHWAAGGDTVDPVFRDLLRRRAVERERVGEVWADTIWHGRSFSWERMKWVMERWREISGGQPFVLSGVQSVEDAELAAEFGVDGIVVTNFGGRQVDGAVASLRALETIAASPAVRDKLTVIFDSGVRTAADVFKAYALGAQFVLVGRPYVWALAAGGRNGLRHWARALLAELEIMLNLSGYPKLGIKSSVVHKKLF